MEGRGRRADTGRTTKGYGGGRRAEREKFLLRFSNAAIITLLIRRKYKRLLNSVNII